MKSLFYSVLLLGLAPQISLAQIIITDDTSTNILRNIDGSQLIPQHICYQLNHSKFVNIGKGGLPKNPNGVLTEGDIDVGLVDSINHPEKVSIIEVNNATETIQKQRKSPAMGWVNKEDGTVKLVAHHSNSNSQKLLWNNNGGCSI